MPVWGPCSTGRRHEGVDPLGGHTAEGPASPRPPGACVNQRDDGVAWPGDRTLLPRVLLALGRLAFC